MRGTILALAAFLVALPCLAQTTWYVDATAPTAGDGSARSPFPSISAAMQNPQLLEYDEISVAPGTYTGLVLMPMRGLKLVSQAGLLATTIEGNVHTKMDSVVEGFSIVTSGLFIDLYERAILRDCVIRSADGLGDIAIQVSNDSRVEGCLVVGFQTAIRRFHFASEPAFVENTILLDTPSFTTGLTLLIVRNCCLPYDPAAGDLVLTYDLVIGDPVLWDPANLDFHLAPGSPCIGAGLGTNPEGSPADIGPLPYDPGYATGPASYCVPTPTGDGCTATISAIGVCSLTSAEPFLVLANGVPPGRVGMLIHSSSPASTPFQGGTLCIAPPIQRTPATNSGPGAACSTGFAFDFSAYVQGPAGPALTPGDIVYAQYWFRDPLSPGGFSAAFTDGLRFGVAP